MQKKTKIIIAVVAAIVVVGGAVGTVLGVNAYNDKKEREAQEATFKEYNDKINAIVTPLNVADANGQNPSIENNNDVNALQTAITTLQGLEKEVTDNTILTEEQKNTIKGTITNSITGIQNRINAINQAQAEAQAEAQAKAEQEAREQAEAEAQRQAQAQASSNKKKNSGGSSSSSSSNASSSNSESSSAANEVVASSNSAGGSSDADKEAELPRGVASRGSNPHEESSQDVLERIYGPRENWYDK